MAASAGWHHSIRAEQKDEFAQQVFLVGQRLGVEQFVGLRVRALVVQPRLAHRGDDDPVAGQIDRVLVSLLDGRQFAARVGTVERILCAFAFDRQDGPVVAVEVVFGEAVFGPAGQTW